MRETPCGCSLLRCVSKVDRRVREKEGVLSLHAVSGGSKSFPFSEKVHSAPVHFFMIFKKVIIIRKNDRLTPPFIADTCFPAVTDVFFCDRRFARRFPFRFASGLLKSDLNLLETRKQRRFFFLAVLVSRGEVSDVSRNIANSGPSKGGLEAKRELKR